MRPAFDGKLGDDVKKETLWRDVRAVRREEI